MADGIYNADRRRGTPIPCWPVWRRGLSRKSPTPSAEAADNISYGKPSRKDVMIHGCSPKRKPTGKRRAVCPDVALANLPGGTTAKGPDRHIGLEAVAESR